MDCSICLEPLGDQAIRARAVCKHEFHRKCIDAWLERADTCPYCRAKFQFDAPPSDPWGTWFADFRAYRASMSEPGLFQFADLRPHCTSPDRGVHMISFGLQSSDWQPSGSMNFSRQREYFLEYDTEHALPLAPDHIETHASSRNILAIRDGFMGLNFAS